ncbi:hypothetical protein OG21DRAFT_1487665 [Imleria badia]|nr:hypothetical protein OG21DRAFT_1487665 [Imleria badia]
MEELSHRKASPVRTAAGSLLATWVDVPPNLRRVALHDALLCIFATRIDIFDQLEFEDAFWDALTKAFLERVCVEHCIATNDQAKLGVSLSVVTHLVFRIQSVYNKYQEDLSAVTHARTALGVIFPVYILLFVERESGAISVAIFEQIAEATDPQKAIEVQGQTIDNGAHLDLAEDILKALFKNVMPNVWCPGSYCGEGADEWDDDKFRTLKFSVYNIFTVRVLASPPLTDPRRLGAQRTDQIRREHQQEIRRKLVGFSDEESRRLKQLEVFFSLDDIVPVPLDDGEEVEMPKTQGRKRCVCGVLVANGGGCGSDDREDDEVPSGRATPVPTRTLPKRWSRGWQS